MSEKILVVDDEPEIVRVLRGYLEQANYTVLTAYSGPEGLRRARTETPDLVLLDVMLPGMDGIDVCRTLRQSSDVPIIMLTARVEETDRVLGLELGADDYVTKPFSPREVVARVRAVLRRTRGESGATTELLAVRELKLDVGRHTVALDGEPVELTPSEFEILRAMMNAPGRVFSRLQLLESAQGQAYEGYERTVDTHVKNLRRKIEPDPPNPVYIMTVHGLGYKLREE
jgi:DNA-binding response OmpR family regulator